MSGEDFATLVGLLESTGRQQLYYQLGFSPQDIEEERKHVIANSDAKWRQSMLQSWKKAPGPKATRKAVLHALLKCDKEEYIETLKILWGLEGKLHVCKYWCLNCSTILQVK